MMLSQPRIFLAMARDGLIPQKFFGDIHPTYRTPWKSTILTGVMVGLAASLLPLDVLANMTNIGTLLASVIIIQLKKTNNGSVDRNTTAE